MFDAISTYQNSQLFYTPFERIIPSEKFSRTSWRPSLAPVARVLRPLHVKCWDPQNRTGGDGWSMLVGWLVESIKTCMGPNPNGPRKK